MTIAEALAWAVSRLQDAPLLEADVEPVREASLLLGHVLQRSRAYCHAFPEVVLDEGKASAFGVMVERRRRGEPVAYLLGTREFWSLSLRVTPDTLIPRPDTELLVELALSRDLPRQARVVDLGTGSGAIACALAHERPDWQILATDRSEAALCVARENVSRLQLGNVTCAQGDWWDAVPAGRYHLLVSNPPYVAADDRHLQRGDLRFEPRSALMADEEGLADLAVLARGASSRLEDGGWLLVEHGFDQGSRVRDLLESAGLEAVHTARDLAGQERVTLGRKRGTA